MTLKEVFEKWKPIADRTTYNVMKQEVMAFVEEAKEAGATFQDVTKRKDQIILLWSPASWKKAQEEFDHWRNKDWYEKRHKWLINHVGRVLNQVYADEISSMKAPPKKAEPAPKARPMASTPPKLTVVPASAAAIASSVEDEFAGFEVFTTHQQVIDHTREYQEKLKRELAQ